MSDTRDPDRDQVEPTPNDNPSCHDLVIADMAERKAFGLRKYNSLLQAHNGRSFTLDAYEEVLDLAVYLRGKLEEERSQPPMSHLSLDLDKPVMIENAMYIMRQYSIDGCGRITMELTRKPKEIDGE